MVPTVHANFRFLTKGETPVVRRRRRPDAVLPLPRGRGPLPPRPGRRLCDRHAAVVDYAQLKKWCDDYFFLPHRSEPRGVGGIFFDYLEGDLEARLRLRARLRRRLPRRLPADRPAPQGRAVHGRARRAFQEFRRGRYVEFNLIYDRGTLFGLKTGGRIESILMSLPPLVRWGYDFRPAAGVARGGAVEVYLKPRDWAAEG